MIFKIALNSAFKGRHSWSSLFVAAVALSIVLTLNIALVIAGLATDGEAQQAYIAMGGVALGFSVLTGLASFILVVGICVRLQRQDAALWQIVGLMPGTAFMILLIEVVLVSIISAAVGAGLSILVWPEYANFVGSSGLPQSRVLEESIPPTAMLIGVLATAVVCVLAGVHAARKVVYSSLVEGAKSSTIFKPTNSSVLVRTVKFVFGIAMVVGVAAIYRAISRGDEIVDLRKQGDFLTTYPGMGLLLCLVFALSGGAVVRLMIWVFKTVPLGGLPKFLASGEATARPRLTSALVVPICLSSASVGVMNSWVDKIRAVLESGAGTANAVSAPPEQMALLLGGPVIAACVAAAAVVFATAPKRQEDNALLLASGATYQMIFAKAFFEVFIYGCVALFCSYLIVALNEVAMVLSLSSGPIPSASFSLPGWSSGYVVIFGTVLTLGMLLVVTISGLRKQSASTLLGGK